ncbi:MAG: divalent-cation tolerance protein CutA [Pseudomonadota bacterium]
MPSSSVTPIAVVTTVATREQARAMARALVERRLAACAQISEIESFYTWEGTVQHEPECRVLLKTTRERYAALEAAIRGLHPYELPAIHAFAMDQAYGPYAAWIDEGTRAQ